MRVSGEEMQEVDRVLEGIKVSGSMAELWKVNMISREIKRELNERVVIPTVVNGLETWSLSAQERRKIEAFEMMCLRGTYVA